MSAVSAEFSHAPANVAASSGQNPGRGPGQNADQDPTDHSDPPAGEQDADARQHSGRSAGRAPGADFGPNELLVDELYQRYQADPGSVDRAWWNFFADYRPEPADVRRPAPRPAQAAATAARAS